MALTLLILLPLVGSGAVGTLAALGRDEAGRRLGLGIAAWTFVLTIGTWAIFEPADPGFQFVARVPWIAPLGVSYFVGIDRVALAFVTLTALVTPLALLGSWVRPRETTAAHVALVLLVEAAAIAAVSARDLLLFFVCSELVTIGCAALIAVWGADRRIQVARRVLASHLIGSGGLLMALTWIGWRHHVATGFWSFAADDLATLVLPAGPQAWLWAAFVLALAVRLPIFPLHTWWPDAVAQAPAAAGIMLGAVSSTIGGYGWLRIIGPLVPEASAALGPWLAACAAAGVVHGAVGALGQRDLRRVVAYLSASHAGLIVLSLSTATVEGATAGVVLLLLRGLWTAGLLLIAGALADRRRTTDLRDFGGMYHVMPRLSIVLMVLAISAAALPASGPFTAVVLGLTAVNASARAFGDLLAVVAIAGVLLWGVAMVRLVIRMIAGPLVGDRNRGLRDLTLIEWTCLLPITVLLLLAWIWSPPLGELIGPDVGAVVVDAASRAVAGP